jgi:hypothetical protein
LSRCTAIKPTGERCKAGAIEGSEWCWNHNPAHADERRRHGQRGGKRGGRGRPSVELGAIKERLTTLADDVLEGSVDRGDAAVVGQLLNTVIRAVGMEMKVREVEELAREVEELRDLLEAQKERRYGA